MSSKWGWEVRVGESQHTAVPDNVVGGYPLVEMHEANGEEGQQPSQGHIAP